MIEISAPRSLKIYKAIASWYDALHHLQTLWADSTHRRKAVGQLALTARSLCIDIGTGTGLTAAEAFSLYESSKIVCLDITLEMLLRARGNLKGYRERAFLVCGDATRLPFRDTSFDAALSVYALGGVENPRVALDELNRTLKTGGLLSAAEMTAPSKSASRLFTYFHRWPVQRLIKLFWEFRDIPLEELIGSSGFVIEVAEYRSDRLFGSTTTIVAEKVA